MIGSFSHRFLGFEERWTVAMALDHGQLKLLSNIQIAR